ncbi:Vacuolar cation/proton exchanger 3 [Glycine max]|nr:Vacuolar cation/proton exchanger 3 [Glycine max]
MLKKLGYTPCKHTFDQNLENFRQLRLAIATWIDRISKEKWTMTYDKEGRRYDHMTTNLSECVNKVLKDYHNIPITALVKSTYNRCRKYFVDRGRQVPRQLNEGQVYCSKNFEKIKNKFVRTSFASMISTQQGLKWAVNLNDHYCQCGKYSALHYPCSHIIAACGYVSINYFQYIDVVYTNEHILKAYSTQWWPLGNETTIPPSDDSWTLIPDPTTIRVKDLFPKPGVRSMPASLCESEPATFPILVKNKVHVVKLSLLGSILSNLLLVLGSSLLYGGLANLKREQRYDRFIVVCLWSFCWICGAYVLEQDGNLHTKFVICVPYYPIMCCCFNLMNCISSYFSLTRHKYHFDDLRMDTDTSVSKTEKMLVVCNTFHGHTLPSEGTNMIPLQQSPFVWSCLKFQHFTGEYETLSAAN